jgi:hypothetical protein
VFHGCRRRVAPRRGRGGGARSPQCLVPSKYPLAGSRTASPRPLPSCCYPTANQQMGHTGKPGGSPARHPSWRRIARLRTTPLPWPIAIAPASTRPASTIARDAAASGSAGAPHRGGVHERLTEVSPDRSPACHPAEAGRPQCGGPSRARTPRPFPARGCPRSGPWSQLQGLAPPTSTWWMSDVAAGLPTMSFHGFRSPSEACSEHLAPRAVERPEPDPEAWPRGVPDLVRRSRLAKSRRPWGATSGKPTSRPPAPRS